MTPEPGRALLSRAMKAIVDRRKLAEASTPAVNVVLSSGHPCLMNKLRSRHCIQNRIKGKRVYLYHQYRHEPPYDGDSGI